MSDTLHDLKFYRRGPYKGLCAVLESLKKQSTATIEDHNWRINWQWAEHQVLLPIQGLMGEESTSIVIEEWVEVLKLVTVDCSEKKIKLVHFVSLLHTIVNMVYGRAMIDDCKKCYGTLSPYLNKLTNTSNSNPLEPTNLELFVSAFGKREVTYVALSLNHGRLSLECEGQKFEVIRTDGGHIQGQVSDAIQEMKDVSREFLLAARSYYFTERAMTAYPWLLQAAAMLEELVPEKS